MDTLLQRHLADLARMADRQNRVTYTDFLNIHEQHLAHQAARESSFVHCVAFGGFAFAERQMATFVPDALFCGEMPVFPISCVRIAPRSLKYADHLEHRDFLGAILSLGIERGAIGDLCVREGQCQVFCKQAMVPFLCQELSAVRHTQVVAKEGSYDADFCPQFANIRGSVASVRLDSLIALAFGGSRSHLSGLVEGGKVYVNGRLVTSNGYKLKENDLVSVRGLGRFRYLGTSGKTRKERTVVELEKFA